MSLSDSICSPIFKSDTGFNIICNWLKNNCHSSLNHDYFIQLSPDTNIKNIKNSQAHTDELLSVLEINNALKLLMYYDDEHKKTYESYLKN